MSTYETLKGLKVKYLAADPSPATEGDVWYDSATYELKSFIAQSAWASVAPLIVATSSFDGAGTQTAGIVFGGEAPSDTGATYEFDGTNWATGGTMNTVRSSLSGTKNGSQTATLAISGYTTTNLAVVESYDGSTWTEVGDVNNSVRGHGGAGTSTAGLKMGGNGNVTHTEEFDGSSWTETANLNTGRSSIGGGGCGIQTAALAVGGHDGSNKDEVESYNGTAWTEVADINTARNSGGSFGITSAAQFAGGSLEPGFSARNEAWDGTSWTEGSDLGTGRRSHASGGVSTTGFVAGGGIPADTATAERYDVTFQLVTPGAWAAGNAQNNTTHEARAAAGSQTAAVIWGGYLPSPSSVTVDTEEYDGSSWTETANLPIGVWNSAGFGTQTAAVSAGGGWNEQGEAGIYRAESKEYDGSSLANGEDMNENRTAIRGCGILTAGLAIGGSAPPYSPDYTAYTEEYDGTDWAAGGALPLISGYGMAAGTQTAALFCGAYTSPPARRHDESYEYDGSSWTAGGDLLYGLSSAASMQQGTITDALIAGGSDGVATQVRCSGYDGTTWSTRPSISSAVESGAGAGTATVGLLCNSNTAPRGITLEFTGATTTATAKTIDFD